MSEPTPIIKDLDWEQRHQRKQPPPAPAPVPVVRTPTTGRDRYAEAAFVSEVDRMASAPEGTRNPQLNKSGFALYGFVAAGRLDESAVHAALLQAALSTGLPESEVRKTLASARNGGMKYPRTDNLPGADTGARYEVSDLLAPGTTLATQTGPSGEEDEEERTSWWPRPIGERVATDAQIPGPTHLVREDGQALLYSGKINGLLGESESGKSWVALHAVVQSLAQGQRVMFLDFEDSAESIFGRLRSMGAEVNLGTLDYANPSEGLGVAQARDLREALDAHAYHLIVVDGVNAAMSILGYEINSNDDATKFAQKLLAPLAGTGACVVTVDHVPKATEQRGRGGIGAQAKRAMMTGCALTVEVQEPFGRGQSGVLKLAVDKDRPGHVRGASAGSKFAGRVHLDSDGERMRMRIEAASNSDSEFDGLVISMPTAVMEKVSRLLEDTSEPLSGRTIRGEVHGKTEKILEAIEALVNAGYVLRDHRAGRGGGDLFSSLRPYREGYEVVPVPGGSQPVPGTTFETGSHPPPPYGGGTGSSPVREPARDRTGSGASMPEGTSSCNRCGEPVDDQTMEQTAGYCVPCGRVMNP